MCAVQGGQQSPQEKRTGLREKRTVVQTCGRGGNESCRHPREEYSRQREQQVQRPWGQECVLPVRVQHRGQWGRRRAKEKRGGGQGGDGQASNVVGHCEDVDFFFPEGNEYPWEGFEQRRDMI